jgi:hypothetical protein
MSFFPLQQKGIYGRNNLFQCASEIQRVNISHGKVQSSSPQHATYKMILQGLIDENSDV